MQRQTRAIRLVARRLGDAELHCVDFTCLTHDNVVSLSSSGACTSALLLPQYLSALLLHNVPLLRIVLLASIRSQQRFPGLLGFEGVDHLCPLRARIHIHLIHPFVPRR